ncbi:PspC domain-containing protein [Kineococcus auxinigenes]|uniref:PspC domain-containing protein n=1 Tax=unclassified Kineococcus TaxID=2621656 RepID=UPI003D7D470A
MNALATTGLVRPARGKLIAGVCAGLGRRFGLSANVVRLLFLLSCLIPGPQFLAYLALWVIMPREGSARAVR